jgi:hypothetical protein
MSLLLGLLLAAASPADQPDTRINIPRGVEHDGLIVSLVHTDNFDDFARAWIAGAHQLPVTEHAVRGRPLKSVVILQGCGAGPDGNCNVTGHFTYVAPNGSTYGEIDARLWSSRPSSNAVPSPGGPQLVVDPPDPMGTWTVRVRVTDNVRHVIVETQAPIIVDTPPTAAAN